ncbi:MAG: M16 family metallopeptidase [Flavobacteriales bacterium]
MKRIYYFLFAALTLIAASCNNKAVQVDRSIVPAAGPAPKIQIGQYKLFTLENGLKVIVVENHKLPKVSYSINLDTDPILEGSKAGYVSMAGNLMSAGTTTKTKAQIDEKVDFLGAVLSTSAKNVFGNCLKKHSEDFLALMADVVLNPSFPQSELDKELVQTKSGLANEKTDPGSISGKIANLLKYGADHPYGEFQSEATIEKITREDLVNYHKKNFKPNVAYLVIVGDITEAEAKMQAEKYFGKWERGNVMGNKFKTPQFPAGNQVAFVPVPGAVQSVIDITYPIDLKPGTQDAIVANVLNNVLGGSGFQTRLMQNLREDKAYTYGAYSEISSDELVGYFSAGASVRNEVTDSAIVQFLFEMDRLVNEPIADSTLQTVKNIMTGSFARSLERPTTVASFAYNIEKYGLPKDYYETYLQKLNAVTAADVQAMAQRLIKPSNAYITVVGNKEVAPKLKMFAASGKVDMYNPDGSVFSEMRPVPAGVTIETVLNNYINALGGKEKLSNLKSFDQKGKFVMGPMAMDMNLKMKDNAKLLMTVNMNGMDLMKQACNGKTGYMLQMGAPKADMTEDELLEIKKQTDPLLELHYAQFGMIAELKGIDSMDGQEVYVVEVKESNGDMSTEYYNVATGLKMKTVAVSTKDGETSTAESIYKEYKDFSGIKVASHIIQTAQGQTFEMTVETYELNPKLDDSLFN